MALGMKKTILNLLFLTMFASYVCAGTSYRIHPSIGYNKNIKFLNGAIENYNPLTLRFGLEFDKGFFGFNKFTITPFYSKIGEDHDGGIDFGLKKIFLEDGSVSPYVHFDLGPTYTSKKLIEQYTNLNFNLGMGSGLEIKSSKNSGITLALIFDHRSNGKKAKNNLKETSFNGDNTGNPGFNTLGIFLGFIYRINE